MNPDNIHYQRVKLENGQLIPDTKQMQFELIYEDEFETTNEVLVYASVDILNNTQFDYRILVVIRNLKEYLQSDGRQVGDNTWSVYAAVAKMYYELPEKQIESIMEAYGTSGPTVYDIFDYGLTAELEHEHSLTETQAKAKAEDYMAKSYHYEGLIGFYLDRPQNKAGATGWDFLDGNIYGTK